MVVTPKQLSLPVNQYITCVIGTLVLAFVIAPETSGQMIKKQVATKDWRGRLARLDDFDEEGRLFHYQIYNHSPAKGTLEITDFSADGTIRTRTLHRGGPTHRYWYVYIYDGPSTLKYVERYIPVRNRRHYIVGLKELMVYEADHGGWLKKPLLLRIHRGRPSWAT